MRQVIGAHIFDESSLFVEHVSRYATKEVVDAAQEANSDEGDAMSSIASFSDDENATSNMEL